MKNIFIISAMLLMSGCSYLESSQSQSQLVDKLPSVPDEKRIKFVDGNYVPSVASVKVIPKDKKELFLQTVTGLIKDPSDPEAHKYTANQTSTLQANVRSFQSHKVNTFMLPKQNSASIPSTKKEKSTSSSGDMFEMIIKRN